MVQVEPIKCPACGAALPPGYGAACPRCGAPLAPHGIKRLFNRLGFRKPRAALPVAAAVFLAVIAGVFIVIISPSGEEAEEEKREEAGVPEAERDETPVPGVWYEAKTAFPLYERPAPESDVRVTVRPGTEFRILGDHRGWYRLHAKEHDVGWAPEDVVRANTRD
jgi:hypothetical protein